MNCWCSSVSQRRMREFWSLFECGEEECNWTPRENSLGKESEWMQGAKGPCGYLYTGKEEVEREEMSCGGRLKSAWVCPCASETFFANQLQSRFRFIERTRGNNERRWRRKLSFCLNRRFWAPVQRSDFVHVCDILLLLRMQCPYSPLWRAIEFQISTKAPPLSFTTSRTPFTHPPHAYSPPTLIRFVSELAINSLNLALWHAE